MVSLAHSPEIAAWAVGFPVTLLHVAVTLLILLGGAGVYVLLSPHRELQQAREGNTAAALSLGGVLLALALPLAFALAGSLSIVGILLWGVTVAAVQLALLWMVDLVLQGLPQRIRDGDLAAATLLTAARLAVAAILAAAVSA